MLEFFTIRHNGASSFLFAGIPLENELFLGGQLMHCCWDIICNRFSIIQTVRDSGILFYRKFQLSEFLINMTWVNILTCVVMKHSCIFNNKMSTQNT